VRESRYINEKIQRRQDMKKGDTEKQAIKKESVIEKMYVIVHLIIKKLTM